MIENDENDENAEIAQLLHSICYDTYVRIPQNALRLVEHYCPGQTVLLQKLRSMVRTDKAEEKAVQIACCLKTILPREDAGPNLEFESYFKTSPEEFLCPSEPPVTDILADSSVGYAQASAVPVDDEICLELEELLNSAT